MTAQARRATPAVRSLRDRRRAEVTALLSTDAARAALRLQGTPLLLLDPDRVRGQYRRLREALPFVTFHYAVKALSHEAVIDALAAEGCSFDIATGEELDLLRGRGIGAERVIHTHPVKKPADIAQAIAAGVGTFVVDSESELDKFRGRSGVRLLVRLAYRSPQAKSDLSSKFGVGPEEAAHLVARATELGLRIAGFSFHVGSQLDDPDRFGRAITDTLALMRRLERDLGTRFDTLDIGGGFPVSYDVEVRPFEEIAAVIAPLLAPCAGRLDIIAEPGRVLVAEAMTLVTSVVGVADRADGRWYHLDDGVYGAYSNVVAEDVHPLVLAVGERSAADAARLRRATLAGPTCDSADVIARGALLPDLEIGDLLASPAMGAYTLVTASRFNGRPVTPVAVVESVAAGEPRLARERMPEPAAA